MGYYNEMAVKLARKTDPTSSKVAAVKLVKSGALTGQCRIVYEALKTYGPATAKELSVKSGLDYHMIARRLPNLKEKGKARVLKEVPMQVWEAV